jgi:hypothetical protein
MSYARTLEWSPPAVLASEGWVEGHSYRKAKEIPLTSDVLDPEREREEREPEPETVPEEEPGITAPEPETLPEEPDITPPDSAGQRI